MRDHNSLLQWEKSFKIFLRNHRGKKVQIYLEVHLMQNQLLSHCLLRGYTWITKKGNVVFISEIHVSDDTM
jgi:hypothetical protein